MYYLNKIVWFFLNPVTMPLMMASIGAIAIWRGRAGFRRLGWVALVFALGLLWFESTLSCVCFLGLPLERPYLQFQAAESLPAADAIVVLGGGIGKCEELHYHDMFESSDRVWHAARLWKCGKAPKVVVSGTNDLVSTVPLLLDLGVPRSSIVVDNESRNTYENSRFTERLVGSGKNILLVTSAWHMPRAAGNFSKTSLKVIPAACDFSACNAYFGRRYWFDWIAPSSDSMVRSNYLFKEWLGRLARK